MSKYENELKAARESIFRDFGSHADIWEALLYPLFDQTEVVLDWDEETEVLRKAFHRLHKEVSSAREKEWQIFGLHRDSETGYLEAIHLRELSRRLRERNKLHRSGTLPDALTAKRTRG